ncbi:hypothetical protein [Paractinoplanes maris]|uniref:hypothetical protein n=1 Tax=Paractinoplanes maris TaxID=1734446 RepID=UPI00202020C0|nr:hypothetical protein [Actinoplanes maris]
MRHYELRIFTSANTWTPDRTKPFAATNDSAALAWMRDYAAAWMTGAEHAWLYPDGSDRSIGSEQGSAVLS